MIFQNVATYSYICTYVLNAQPYMGGEDVVEYTFTLLRAAFHEVFHF